MHANNTYVIETRTHVACDVVSGWHAFLLVVQGIALGIGSGFRISTVEIAENAVHSPLSGTVVPD